MSLARTERTQLCDLFDQVGPDAPTLCGGWTTADLAAHLWVRETDPLAAPGLVAKPLQSLTEKRMTSAKEKLGFEELVARLRKGPTTFSVFALPGLDAAANGIEYFVHHEDVRRAQATPASARELSYADQDEMWRRLGLMGRAMFRKVEVPVRAERTDVPGDPIVLKPGDPAVVMRGTPAELTLFAFGRSGVADVELVGDQASVELLRTADLGI